MRSSLARPLDFLKTEFDWAIEHTDSGRALEMLAARHTESLLFEPPSHEITREVAEIALLTRVLEILRAKRDHEFDLLLVESDKELRHNPGLTSLEKLAA